MGFITSLMGLTGTGKYMAAKNALVAKYTYQSLDNDMKKKVDHKIVQMLIEGGFPSDLAIDKTKNMFEAEYFGMAAFALDSYGILPPLKNICFMGHWEIVNNPLTALINAENEISNASNEILRKHGISIMLEKKKHPAQPEHTNTQNKTSSPQPAEIQKNNSPPLKPEIKKNITQPQPIEIQKIITPVQKTEKSYVANTPVVCTYCGVNTQHQFLRECDTSIDFRCISCHKSFFIKKNLISKKAESYPETNQYLICNKCTKTFDYNIAAGAKGAFGYVECPACQNSIHISSSLHFR